MYNTYSTYLPLKGYMMRQVSAAQQQRIIEAAEKLTGEGVENPTNDQVREAMGGGSIADISPVMRTWREKQKQTTTTLLQMPDSLKTAATRFAAEMWRTADAEAQKEIEAVRTEVSGQLTVVTAERDEALQEVVRLEQIIKERDSAISGLKSELEKEKEQSRAGEKTAQNLAAERDKATILLEASEKRADEIAATLKEVQEQQRELQKELVALAKAGKK